MLRESGEHEGSFSSYYLIRGPLLYPLSLGQATKMILENKIINRFWKINIINLVDGDRAFVFRHHPAESLSA